MGPFDFMENGDYLKNMASKNNERGKVFLPRLPEFETSWQNRNAEPGDPHYFDKKPTAEWLPHRIPWSGALQTPHPVHRRGSNNPGAENMTPSKAES